MSKREVLRNEAEEKLNKLNAEYQAKKNAKELDSYKEDAKKEYLANLSKEYYAMAENLRKEYREKIYDAGTEEVAALEKQLKEKELIRQNKKNSMEDLLAENNKLIFSTYMLNNGSVDQIKNLLTNNPDNIQIKELVKAKLNTVGTDAKNNYSEVQQIITEAETDKVQQLQSQIQSEFSNESRYPTNRPFPVDLRTMFNLDESVQSKFFN